MGRWFRTGTGHNEHDHIWCSSLHLYFISFYICIYVCCMLQTDSIYKLLYSNTWYIECKERKSDRQKKADIFVHTYQQSQIYILNNRQIWTMACSSLTQPVRMYTYLYIYKRVFCHTHITRTHVHLFKSCTYTPHPYAHTELHLFITCSHYDAHTRQKGV